MFVEMKAIIDDHDATIGIHKVVTDSHAKELVEQKTRNDEMMKKQ